MAWSDPSLLVQYDAAANGAAIVRLPGWTTVLMTGADRASFLHNMCTNDIRSLPAGGQCEAFFTDVKGKIVGHIFVFADAEKIALVTVPGQAARLIAHLDRYIIREDVQLRDDSENTAWSLVVRPAAETPLGGSGDIVRPCQLLWPGGFWLGTPASDPQPAGATECSEQVGNTLRIESGWPLFGVDFDGGNLPQEVARNDQAICFRKGCYLGQETIARIDALGHVNKRLATVKFTGDEPPTPGAVLAADGQSVGHVTSACWSPRLGAPLALAMLRRGHNDPRAKLLCGDQPAEVIPTPAVPHLTPAPR
jgi:tRNA-modifying protein YgfZ